MTRMLCIFHLQNKTIWKSFSDPEQVKKHFKNVYQLCRSKIDVVGESVSSRLGSRDGTVVEHLPPAQARFDSQTRRHMWVEFVVGSRPCSERFFPGCSGFPLSSKTNISKFQFDLESEGHKFISLGLLRATLVKQRLSAEYYYFFILRQT